MERISIEISKNVSKTQEGRFAAKNQIMSINTGASQWSKTYARIGSYKSPFSVFIVVSLSSTVIFLQSKFKNVI